MIKESKHPQIFSDVITVFEMYYRIHDGMPKSFKITVGEKVLHRLSNAMHSIVLANNVDKKTKEGREQGSLYLAHLRGDIEIALAFILLGWKLRFVSNAVMAELSERFENISYQALKWEKWFLSSG